MLLIACANDDSSNDPAKLKLSGTWDIHGISTNPVNQDFVITHQQVGISELNNQVVIDNCLNNRDRTFTRDKNYLINEAGEKLRIVDEHTIESISVPDIRLLYKSSSEHFHDAGSVTLQSNTLPTINAVSQVCAQQITRPDDDQINLYVSIPFEKSYIDITLIVADLTATTNNVSEMTFESPGFMSYYGTNKLETLYGTVTFSELTTENVSLNFDITVKEFSTFPGDQLVGSIDVHL